MKSVMAYIGELYVMTLQKEYEWEYRIVTTESKIYENPKILKPKDLKKIFPPMYL